MKSTRDYHKTAEAGTKPAKQIAHEALPSRYSRATITGGDPINRSIGQYAKATPASASGEGMIGYNLHSMARG